jgi:hypothetical protein
MKYLRTSGSPADIRLLALNITFRFYYEFVKDSSPQLGVKQLTEINRKFLQEYRTLLLLRGQKADGILRRLDTLSKSDPLPPEAVSTFFPTDAKPQAQGELSARFDAKQDAYLAKLPSKLP